MGFLTVQTYQFRNLTNNKINTQAEIVYLVGPNGQGKTNFLESIYLLSFGSSFRTANNDLLVREKADEMSVHGEFEEAEGDSLSVGIRIQNKKKEIRVNGKPIRDRKEIIKNIPCIVFSHDDIKFVKGAPDEKRFFFNQTMSLMDPSFVDVLRNYNKLLKMRNIELKNGNLGDLDIYDVQLAELGLEIQHRRERIIEDFNETFYRVYAEITKNDTGADDARVRIRYSPSWKGLSEKNEVLAVLRDKLRIDRDLGFTTSGPHRDRFVFKRDGQRFSSTASTGQFRLAALTLRVAQAIFCTESTQRKPVLLLDDVLLELDGRRKTAFLQALPPFEQAFFTFLPEENYSPFYPHRETMVYSVDRGKLNHEKSR